jgi:hypothetical protein
MGTATTLTPSALQTKLVELASTARAVDIRPYETVSVGRVLSELLPPCRRNVEEMLSLAEHVANEWDAASPNRPPRDEDDDTVQMLRDMDALTSGTHARPTTPRTADVAFLAAVHLRARSRALVGMSPNVDGWAVVGLCGSALRQVAKTAAAIDAALAGEYGVERKLLLATELTYALEIRRRYADLRVAIAAGHEQAATDLRAALRRIGGAIAVLVGKPVYPHLRLADRIQIRALQSRVLVWLRDTLADDREGRRILQDLQGFADITTQVNRRQELVEHDHEVARRVGPRLGEGTDLDDDVHALLTELRGRDVTIDALLAAGSRSTAAWRHALETNELISAVTETRARSGT